MRELLYYFAYGSNMAIERLGARISPIERVSTARLDGHRLRFHKVSHNDGSGKCDAEMTGLPNHEVHGVLYTIGFQSLEILDLYEGVGFGYERRQVGVVTPSGVNVEAEIYTATYTDPRIRPYSWYKEHVLRGAVSNGLPVEYVAMIEAIATEEDPDRERHRTELAIYT